MDALDLLKQQHAEAKALFEKYEGEDDPAARRQLFVELADALSAHTTIEERIFYPGVKIPPTESILERSVEEHLGVKRSIAKLLDLDPSGEPFDAEMKALHQEVSTHLEEEEGELFPLVRNNFTDGELALMGDRMEALFEQLSEEEPRNDVREQLDRPASLD